MDRGTAPDQWYVHVRDGRELPLRESPLRFAVVMGDGSTSNGWRVGAAVPAGVHATPAALAGEVTRRSRNKPLES